MTYEITAPSADDETIAGIHFIAGLANADDLSPGVLLYFRRHGYEVEQLNDAPAGDEPAAPTTAKGRTARAK